MDEALHSVHHECSVHPRLPLQDQSQGVTPWIWLRGCTVSTTKVHPRLPLQDQSQGVTPWIWLRGYTVCTICPTLAVVSLWDSCNKPHHHNTSSPKTSPYRTNRVRLSHLTPAYPCRFAARSKFWVAKNCTHFLTRPVVVTKIAAKTKKIKAPLTQFDHLAELFCKICNKNQPQSQTLHHNAGPRKVSHPVVPN